MSRFISLTLLAVVFVAVCQQESSAQTTEFTFQGSLKDNAAPANGNYDFEFALFDMLSAGSQIGSTITKNNIAVANGGFSVKLDFGSVFPGADRFLETRVRLAGQPGFTTLSPRQFVNSVPYSIKSKSTADADLLGGQSPSNYATAGQLSALEMQVITLQGQIAQLKADLEAATGGSQLWSRSFGSDMDDRGYSVAVDASGNVLVTGSFRGVVNFGGGNLVSVGSSPDIFVAKYSGVTGSHIWSKSYGNSGSDEGLAVAVDAAGNVFVTGNFNGMVNFGGVTRTSNGLEDVFLIKLSGTNGATVWARNFGGASSDAGYSVAVDGSGNPVITGSFVGTADFLGLPLVSVGGTDIFVAKYNGATSSHIWSKGFGSISTENGYGVASDAAGNVFVTGSFLSSAITFGGPDLQNAGLFDGYLVKLASADGSHIWSKSFGGTSFDDGYGVAVDSSGNSFVTGSFVSSSIDMGGGPLQNAGPGAGTSDSYLAKYDIKGVHQWSKAIGAANNEVSQAIALDSAGNPAISGYFTANSNFGGPSFISFGGNDIFAAKYSGANGAHQWSRRFGGTSDDNGRGVALDSTGDVFLTGYYFSITIDFGGGPLNNATANGSSDIFVVKLKK